VSRHAPHRSSSVRAALLALLTGTLLLGALLIGTGCRAKRYLEISTSPAGAEVRLDDEAVGVTPVKVPFEHYGTRRLTFYKAGYRTSARRIKLDPPWYGHFPLDIVTEVLLPFGWTDRRRVHQELVQGEEVMSLPSLRSVIERANALRQSGPEGPQDLPQVDPSVVPSEPTPEPEPGPEAPPSPAPDPEGSP
jgi:PEGA domain-containing protein